MHAKNWTMCGNEISQCASSPPTMHTKMNTKPEAAIALTPHQPSTPVIKKKSDSYHNGSECKKDAPHSRGSSLRRRLSVSSGIASVEPVHLGDRIHQFKSKSLFPSSEHLWAVILSLLASFVAVNATVFLINEFLIKPSLPDQNFQKNFIAFENPDEEIVKDTIPFLQQWYRGIDADLLFNDEKTDQIQDSSCLQNHFDSLSHALPFTSPKIVERVLESMGLSDKLSVRSHVGDWLNEPQSLAAFYNISFHFLKEQKGVLRLACETEKMDLLDLSNPALMSYLGDSIHSAVVMNALTVALTKDSAALQEVIEVMTTTQLLRYQEYVEKRYHGAEKEFWLNQYRGTAAFALQMRGATPAENVGTSGSLHFFPQMNILSSVKMDINNGLEGNALVGLALAASTQFAPVADGSLALTEAYTTWKMASVLGSSKPRYLAELLIPSVSYADGRESVLLKQTVASALALMQIYRPLFSEIDDTSNSVPDMERYYYYQSESEEMRLLGHRLAISLGRHMTVAVPSKHTVEKMLYNLCDERCHGTSWKVTDSAPLANLDDLEFNVYIGIITWVTVLLAGIGFELLTWIRFLHEGWSEETETRWRFAQFVFPLFAATTLGLSIYHNYLALIFLVAGLWKFGFPETLVYMFSAIYMSENRPLHRVAEFLNGVGVAVHHGAASLLICMILGGVGTPDRHVIGPILILMMQHWFVLVIYVNNTLYIVLELSLELWFEWVVISDFEYLASNHWTTAQAAACMLVAHWMFLAAAGIELLAVGDANGGQGVDRLLVAADEARRVVADSDSAPLLGSGAGNLEVEGPETDHVDEENSCMARSA